MWSCQRETITLHHQVSRSVLTIHYEEGDAIRYACEMILSDISKQNYLHHRIDEVKGVLTFIYDGEYNKALTLWEKVANKRFIIKEIEVKVSPSHEELSNGANNILDELTAVDD